MPSCIVKGCNFSWKKKDPNVILHSFPGDLGAIRSWLVATKQDFPNMDELCQKILLGKAKGLYRMCSQHFTRDCYYQRGMLLSLKKEALPTIFPDKEAVQLKARIPKTYKPRKKPAPPPYPSLVGSALPTSMAVGLPLRVTELEADPASSLNEPCYISEQGYYVPHSELYGQIQAPNAGEVLPPPSKTRTLGTNTEYFPGQRHKATLTDENMRHKEVQTEDGQGPCWCRSRDGTRLANHLHPGPRTSGTITPTLPTVDRTLPLGIELPSNSPEIPPSGRSKADICDVGCSHSRPTVKEEIPFANPVSGDPHTEQNLRPGSVKAGRKSDMEPSGGLGIKPEDLARVEIPGTSLSPDPSSENKYIVYDSCLNKLLMYCRCLADDGCNGGIVKFKKFFVGSSVSVKAECSNGHRFHMWDSQP